MTQLTLEIRCPQCGSHQISANKKGFSGKKAVVGGLLTGGIGILAGTIGKNKIVITCLACGKVFKPGEGKTIDLTPKEKIKSIEELNEVDKWVIEQCTLGHKLASVKYVKDKTGKSLVESKLHVEGLVKKYNIQNADGCFIATACYNDYNAHEVVLLRKYRDNSLSKSIAGRSFIKVYYFISPTLSKYLSKSKLTKRIIKSIFLDPIIGKIK